MIIFRVLRSIAQTLSTKYYMYIPISFVQFTFVYVCVLDVCRPLCYGHLNVRVHLSSFPVFSWVCVARSFVFCVAFCRSLFVLRLVIVLSVLFSTPVNVEYVSLIKINYDCAFLILFVASVKKLS